MKMAVWFSPEKLLSGLVVKSNLAFHVAMQADKARTHETELKTQFNCLTNHRIFYSFALSSCKVGAVFEPHLLCISVMMESKAM